MARDAAAWLVRHERYARTVTIKVRYHDFTTITRSHSDDADAGRAKRSSQRAVALLEKTEAGERPVRLLGVSVHNLCTDFVTVPMDRRPGSRSEIDTRRWVVTGRRCAPA